jgi:ketosteroid isomerase-like protein
MLRFGLALVISLILVSCASKVDVEGERQILLDTDRAFAAHSVENGPADAFKTFLIEDALQLPNGAAPIHGRTNIVAAMESGPEFGLDWDPQRADVSSSADLGWTWGTYVATFQDSSGADVQSAGKYLNVWQKLSDGSWRVVVDMGNQP